MRGKEQATTRESARMDACLESRHLVKECLQVAGSQLQAGELIQIGLIQILNPVVIVVHCYILVRKLKVVGQNQDVSANKTFWILQGSLVIRSERACGCCRSSESFILRAFNRSRLDCSGRL